PGARRPATTVPWRRRAPQAAVRTLAGRGGRGPRHLASAARRAAHRRCTAAMITTRSWPKLGDTGNTEHDHSPLREEGPANDALAIRSRRYVLPGPSATRRSMA